MQQIERGIKEREKNLTPSIPYEWEKRRDERVAYEKRIAELEKKLARTQALMRRLPRDKQLQRRLLLEEEILSLLDPRTARMPNDIYPALLDSYGEVSMRTVMRTLARLVQEDRVLRVMDGYLLPRGG